MNDVPINPRHGQRGSPLAKLNLHSAVECFAFRRAVVRHEIPRTAIEELEQLMDEGRRFVVEIDTAPTRLN